MTTFGHHLDNADAMTCVVAAAGMPDAAPSLDAAQLQSHFSAANSACSQQELAERLAPLLATTSASCVVLCQLGSQGGDALLMQRLYGDETELLAAKEEVVQAGVRALAGGNASVQKGVAGEHGPFLVWPLPGHEQQCLVVSLSPALRSGESLMTLQAVAVQIAAWQTARDAAARELIAKRMAALTELQCRLEASATVAEACRSLANELQRYLECQQVIIGLCPDGSSRCRVESISGVDSVQRHSEKTRLAEAALEEVIARGETSIWPASDDSGRYGLKAQQQFASATEAETLIGSSLIDDQGTVLGAWLLAGDAADLKKDDVLAMIHAAEKPVASLLGLLKRAQHGRLRRMVDSLCSQLRRRRGRVIVAVAFLCLLSLLAPVPHRVKCDCLLEPVTRRFVAAPFAGPLDKALVQPGDLVTEGQLLAQMDGREVRWELAGVQADRYRALKERAGHVAAHEAGAAEIARYEAERLQYREQLLKARDHDLEIRSPVDGIVVSGDLKDAEGMPLDVGEVLFEVAPLDAMIVELSVPEDEVSFVCGGMPVRITFDALPFRSFEATIERVHPRAELRDEENIFVAEVRIDNPRQILHPGMRGHARVDVGSARLGWVLLRRPASAALEWLGW